MEVVKAFGMQWLKFRGESCHITKCELSKCRRCQLSKSPVCSLFIYQIILNSNCQNVVNDSCESRVPICQISWIPDVKVFEY